MRALALALLFATAATAGTNQWTRPGSGLRSVVNVVVHDPTQPARLLAGAEDGLYLSGDGGATWRTRGDSLRGRSVLSAMFHPGHASVLLAGISSGLMVSADSGYTWIARGAIGSAVLALAAGPDADTTLYAGTFGRGVLSSRDGGQTWSQTGGTLASDIVFALTTSELAPARVYAGTARGLFVSENRGASWSSVGQALQGLSVRTIYAPGARNDAGIMAVGTFGHGFWRSADLGVTWTAHSAGMPDAAIRSLSVDPEYGQLVYAATSTGGFFRSDDGGLSWQAINDGLPSLSTRQVLALPGSPRRLLGVGAAAGVWEISFTPQAQLDVSRAPLAFGSVPVGATESRAVELTSVGDATLVVASLAIEGDAGFSVTPGSASIGPGESLPVAVRFAPGSRGERRAALVVASNDPDAERVRIELQATGVQGALSAGPPLIHFGEVLVGAQRDTLVVLTNSGNADLAVASVYSDSDAFRVLSFTADTLAPGQSRLVRVRFAPLSARGMSGRLVIAHSATPSPLTIQMDGTGAMPEIVVTPTGLDFGTVNLGAADTLAVRIRNDGNAPLTVNRLQISGERFSGYLSVPTVIAPGDSHRVDVVFMPLTAGSHAGVLSIGSDAPGPFALLRIELRGVGGGLTLSPQSPIAAGAGAVDLLVADWNGDGAPDLAVADSAGGEVRVFLNDGTGAFPDAAVYPGPSSLYGRWQEPVALAAAPMFSPHPDLIVADRGAQSLYIVANEGGLGRFDQRREQVFVGHRVTDVLVADLDADGDIDIVVANGDTASLTLLYNNGAGSLNARVTTPVQAGPVALAAANLNADGRPDLVVANRDAGSVSVLLSSRTGGFEPRQDYVVGLATVDLALADYDADGDNDILAASRGSADVAILRNTVDADGSVRLVPGGYAQLAFPVVDIAASDLTADVFGDLVAAGAGASMLAFLENEGGARFASRDALALIEPARRAEIADLTGDGANDIAVLGLTRLQVFVNQDTRRLDPPRPPTALLAADAAGDLGRRIQITWSAPDLDEQIGRTTDYVLYRASSSAGAFAPIGTVAAGRRSTIDSTVALADTFFYYVRAGNAAIWSEPSDTVWAVSRPSPFFELQLVDEPDVNIGDTLRVRAFVTPADHRLVGVSLYLTFADSALSLLLADTTGGVRRPFRIASGLASATVFQNRLHQGSSRKADLSLGGLTIQPGVEPVELGEVWFRTRRDTVTHISVDDDLAGNRQSGVVEDSTGAWVTPYPVQPMRVDIHDYRVNGRVTLKGRDSTNVALQATLLLVRSSGDTLRSPLNDEDRVRPGIQRTLAADGSFRLNQVPAGRYQLLIKTPSHLQGRARTDSVVISDTLSVVRFQWIKSDSTVFTELPAGDANNDNRVNLADFGVFVRYFGLTSASVTQWPAARAADFDGSGAVDLSDLFLLADDFGEVGMGVRAGAGKPAAGALSLDPDGAVRVSGCGPITGFSLLVMDAPAADLDLSQTVWAGREVAVHWWPGGAATRFAAALLDPGAGVDGEGVVVRVPGAAAGPPATVIEAQVLGADGVVSALLLVPAGALPRHSALLQNYPNPFNPATTVPFVVGVGDGAGVPVRLAVYNSVGQRVRLLVDQPLAAGLHRVAWDGLDDQGRELASGLYICQLRLGTLRQQRRLLLLR